MQIEKENNIKSNLHLLFFYKTRKYRDEIIKVLSYGRNNYVFLNIFQAICD